MKSKGELDKYSAKNGMLTSHHNFNKTSTKHVQAAKFDKNRFDNPSPSLSGQKQEILQEQNNSITKFSHDNTNY